MFQVNSALRGVLAVALGLAALTPAPARALPAPPAPMGLGFQASLRGPGQALAGAGDYLYVSQGGHLAVLDLTAPVGQQQVGSLALDGEITDLAVSGSTLLAIVWPRTTPRFALAPHIEWVSLANPADPQPTGRLAGATPNGWSIDGDNIYMGSANGVMTVVTPGATPGAPTIAQYTTAITSGRFVARGSYLFAVDDLTDTFGVRVFDTTPGANFRRVAETEILAPWTSGINATALVGDLLFISTNFKFASPVYALDVSDPTAPTSASAGLSVQAAFSDGNTVALLTYAGPNGPQQQAQLRSIADPVDPTLLHAFDIPRSTAGTIIGHRFYFTGPQHLSFIDLTAVQPSVQTLDVHGGAVDWEVIGDRLYTAEFSDDSLIPSFFKVLEITDRAQPLVVAALPEVSPLHLVIEEPHAVTSGLSRWTLYDVGVTTPTVAYSTTTASPIWDLALDGDTLALLQPDATRVYDLAPATPALIATVPVTGTNVALSGSLLWIYNSSTGHARAIDLTTPNAPVISDAAEFGQYAYAGDVTATGDLLLLGMVGGELVVVHRQPTGAPTATILDLTTWTGPTGILSLDVKDSEVLVGLSEGRCAVVDISAPTAPAPMWIASIPGRPCDARWDGPDLILGPYTETDLVSGYDSFRVFPLAERVWLPVIGALGPQGSNTLTSMRNGALIPTRRFALHRCASSPQRPSSISAIWCSDIPSTIGRSVCSSRRR